MSRIKLFKFSNILFLQILLCTLSFVLSYIYAKSKVDTPTHLSVSSLSGFLLFFANNKDCLLMSIATHNTAIAIISYIASVFTLGVLSFIPLICSFNVFGIVLSEHTDIGTLTFVIIEMFGILLSVISGTLLAFKRKEELISIRGSAVYSIASATSVFGLYILAAFIEKGVIINGI